MNEGKKGKKEVQRREKRRREKWTEGIKLGNKDQRKKKNGRKKYENKESKN